MKEKKKKGNKRDIEEPRRVSPPCTQHEPARDPIERSERRTTATAAATAAAAAAMVATNPTGN